MKEKKENQLKETLLIILLPLIIVFSILFGIKLAGIYPVSVFGESMSPTFHNGTFLLMKKTEPKNNDIIIFTPDESWEKVDGKRYIKRIIASEGDVVEVNQNEIKVNGKVVKEIENYPLNIIANEFTVPENSYFVMGDNYTKSNDSLYELSMGNSNYFINKSQVYSIGKDLFDFNLTNNS